MTWFHTIFHQNTMLENYIFLIQTIYNQINSEISDYVRRDYVHQKIYIQYFLENIEYKYKNRLFEIISETTLKEKVLDAEFGFNNCCEEDYEEFLDISNAIYNELHINKDSCVICGCELNSVCGCVCGCDTCSLSGCTYIK